MKKKYTQQEIGWIQGAACVAADQFRKHGDDGSIKEMMSVAGTLDEIRAFAYREDLNSLSAAGLI